MPATSLPILNHDLAADEIAWAAAIQADFTAARAALAERGGEVHPRETLREVLARDAHRLPTPLNLAAPGVWGGGCNRHGRGVAAVFMSGPELHTHNASRTDQFVVYVVGEADAFALDETGAPVLSRVEPGGHFHNPPGAPHAFLPRAGQPTPENWQIAFLAITPRNLQEDTQAVSADVRAAYRRATGTEAPERV